MYLSIARLGDFLSKRKKSPSEQIESRSETDLAIGRNMEPELCLLSDKSSEIRSVIWAF